MTNHIQHNNDSVKNILDEKNRLRFLLLCILLFVLAIYRIKPDQSLWQYPLAPHSYNHHHTIISVLDDLYKDPEFLKGDLVVEAVKKYFLPHKYIQFLFVNKAGMGLPTYVNIYTLFAILTNFIGIALVSYVLAANRTAILVSLLIFVVSNEQTLLRDAPVNFPRFFSQGICLISLFFFLKKRYLLSLMICASAFIFHYGMPFYLSFIYFLYLFMRTETISRLKLLLYFSFFSIIVSAISVEMIKNILSFHGNNGFDFDLWKKIILDTGGWSYMKPGNLIRNILFPFLFFYVGIRELTLQKELAYLFIAYLLTQLLHAVVFNIFFIPSLIRPTIFNAGYYMPLFMLIIYSAVLTKQIYKNNLTYKDIITIYLLSSIYFLYILAPLKLSIGYLLPAVIIFLYLYALKTPSGWDKDINSAKVPFLIFAVLISLIVSFSYLYEIKKIKEQVIKDRMWLDIQLWVKDNTSVSDKFIAPVNDDYLHGIQIYGKRSVMNLKPMDLHFIVILNPNLTKEVVREFASPWEVPKKDGIPLNFSSYDLLTYPKMAGNNLQKNDLIKLRNKYNNLSFIITDGREIAGLQLVYQNKDYKIFKF